MYKKALSDPFVRSLAIGTIAGSGAGTAYALSNKKATQAQKAGVILLATACGALGGAAGGYLVNDLMKIHPNSADRYPIFRY